MQTELYSMNLSEFSGKRSLRKLTSLPQVRRWRIAVPAPSMFRLY